MITNSGMTHYHKTFDKEERLEKWTRYAYNNVMWQGGKGTRLNKGMVEANDVVVRIPYSKNSVSIDNFSIGDIICKGIIDVEFNVGDIDSQSDLECENYNIMSIRDNNFGVLDIQHIHIGAK